MLIVQLACAASVAPQVVSDLVKSSGSAPAMVMLLNVTDELILLSTVTVFAAVGLPSPWLPNASDAGVAATCTTPVPLSATVCGLLPASSATVRVAARGNSD